MSVTTSRDMIRTLAAMIKKAEEPEQLMKKLATSTVEMIGLCFDESKSPGGEAWKPLKYRSGQPLKDTGLLQNSFDYHHGKTFFEVGTNVSYAHIHQLGAIIKAQPGNPGTNNSGERKGASALRFMVNGIPVFAKQVTIPARPFLPSNNIPDNWLEDYTDVIQRFITGQ